MSKTKIAIVGVGNCTSALLQGIHYYDESKRDDAIGLMHWEIGGIRPCDIAVVAAFDIDARKVGTDLSQAIFAAPNCAVRFHDNVPCTGTIVHMGRILDGCPAHMADYDRKRAFMVADATEPTQEDVVKVLRETGAEILLNYLPVGSEEATRFYAECALEAGVGFINNIPVFVASDESWARRFAERRLPVIGDDIKSQLGATIVHRMLTELFSKRGVQLDRTYQLNTGGNTDFLNMLDRERLASKKASKTEAIQSVAKRRLEDDSIHVGPSDYVPWQHDNKICFIRMEGRMFGDVLLNLDLRMSVEDSPNSAGVVIDAIRCCKLALSRGQGGVLDAPSAYFCKHPPRQYGDEEAWRMTEAFIDGSWRESPNDPGKAPRERST